MKRILIGLLAVCLGAEPVRVIFDTDMGNDIDDALALAVLHAFESRGEAKLLAVTVLTSLDQKDLVEMGHTGTVSELVASRVVQARAAGEIGSLSELREVVRSSESLVEYEPRNTAAWNAVWERFQRLQ